MPKDLPNLIDLETKNESSPPPPLSIDSGHQAEEMISAMPARFKKGTQKIVQDARFKKPSSGKKKIRLFLVIFLVIFLILAGSFAFYFWASDYLQPKPTVITPPAPPSPPPVYQSPEIKLTAEIRHQETGEVLSSAEFFLPEGALAQEMVFEFKGLDLPAEMPTSTFVVLAGFYKISLVNNSVLPVLSKPMTLKINYAESLVRPEWESFIKIGYFKDDLWTPVMESILETVNNTISAIFSSFPADTFGLIVERVRVEPPVSLPPVIAPQVSSSQDSDADGLTDVEEAIYQTEVNNPDTDGDGVPDGLEIVNLTNPKVAGAVALSLSGLINVYTNPSWSYTLFYPANWIVRALPETDNRQIMVVTNTGEFFQVLVEDNQEQLSPKNWYLQKAPRVDPETVREETIGGLSAIWSPDNLHLYLGKGDKIYILSYDIGTETLANFKTTFQMMIKSFGLISPTVPSETSQEEEQPGGGE